MADITSVGIQQNGTNVGIGTLSPAYKLEVNGATGISGQTTVTSDSTEQITIRTATDTNRQLLIGYNYSGNYGAIQAVQQGTAYRNLILNQSGGNVGIGTTSPSYKLHIVESNNTTPFGISVGSNATYLFTGNSTSGYTTTFNINDTGLYIGHNSSGRSLNLQTNNTDRLTILGGGNVGIGTTSPAYTLDVNGPGRFTGFGINATPISTGTSANFARFTNTGGDFYLGQESSTAGGFFTGALAYASVLYSGTSQQFIIGGTSRMIINTSGNVGIGTTSPTEKLNVVTTGGKSTISIGNTASSTYSQLLMYGGATKYNWSIGAQYNVNNALEITPSTATEGTTFSTPVVTILQGGSVGIGTTSPTEKLDVIGGALAAGNGTIRTGITYSTLGLIGTFTNHDLGVITNGTTKMTILSGGNVGIGTTSPAFLLDVSGPVASEAGQKDNITTRTKSGFWQTDTATTGEGWPTTTNTWQHLISSTHSNTANYYSLQIAAPFFTQNFYIRSTNDSGTQAWSSIATGTGTTNYVTKWASSTILGNSVIFDNGTNVGIGTTSPEQKLHVEGTIQLGNQENLAWAYDNGSYYNYITNVYNTTDGLIYRSGAWTGNTDMICHSFETHIGGWIKRLVINQNGNVGIGTTSPGYKLAVAGDVQLGTGLNRPVQYDSNGGNFRITANAGGWATGYFFNGSSGTFRGGFGGFGNANDLGYYWIGGDYNAATMYITSGSSGMVGINTSSPYDSAQYSLDVNGGLLIKNTGKTAQLVLQNADPAAGGNNGFIVHTAGGTTTGAFAAMQTYYGASVVAGTLRLQPSGGNVGIGTTSAAAKLDVNGTFVVNSNTTTGTSAGVVNLGTTGDPSDIANTSIIGLTWGLRGDSAAYYVVRSNKLTYGSYSFNRLDLSWHTGIVIGAATTYGGTRFYNNSIFTGTQIASIGDGDNNLRSTADIIAYASDKRLKENITNIPNALDKVLKINGVYFDWKDKTKELGFEPSQKHDVGVIAQEIQAILPEVVTLAPFDYELGKSKSGEDYLTVKYEKIVPLLIEAIKEQQKQIDELKYLLQNK